MNGRAQRLATKPTESRAWIGVRPIASAASVASASAGSPLRSPATISTSFIAGRRVEEVHADDRARDASTPSAIAVTESEEVLVASTEISPVTASRRPNSSRFSSRSSGAASTISSRPASDSSSGAAPSRASAATACSGLQRPRSTPFSIAEAARVDPLVQRLRVGVVKQRLHAAEDRDLRDPGPHRAGADNTDCAHGRRAHCEGGGSSPSQNGTESRSK